MSSIRPAVRMIPAIERAARRVARLPLHAQISTELLCQREGVASRIGSPVCNPSTQPGLDMRQRLAPAVGVSSEKKKTIFTHCNAQSGPAYRCFGHRWLEIGRSEIWADEMLRPAGLLGTGVRAPIRSGANATLRPSSRFLVHR